MILSSPTLRLRLEVGTLRKPGCDNPTEFGYLRPKYEKMTESVVGTDGKVFNLTDRLVYATGSGIPVDPCLENPLWLLGLASGSGTYRRS